MTKHKALGIFNTFWSFWFDKPMEVFQFFRDRVGELSFTCFINYASDDCTSLRKNVEYFKTATLAEFFVVPPVLLFNYEPHLFRLDRDIYNFIKQNGYLRTICDEVYKLKKKEIEEKDQNEVLQFLAGIPPFGWIINIIDLILANPYKLIIEYANQIDSIIQQHNQNIINVSNAILNKFTVDIAKQSVINISKETCLAICPILPYVVPDLVSKIKLIKAYQSVKPKERRNFNLSDVIKNLLARLYINDRKIAFKEVNAKGSVCFEISKKKYELIKPREIMIDVMGLKRTYVIIPAKIVEDWEKVFERPLPLKIIEDWEGE